MVTPVNAHVNAATKDSASIHTGGVSVGLATALQETPTPLPQVMCPQSGEESIVLQVACEPGVVLPVYATEGSSGMDLRAFVDSPVTLGPGERRLISTGMRIVIPHGFEGQIRSRSGLALKHGVMVLNSPGTIDASYRGEVKVLLFNAGQEDFVIEPGLRMAQLVLAPVVTGVWHVVTDIDVNSNRGVGGFGSTGLK